MQKMHEIFPNGCSSKQLDKLRQSWFEKYGNPFCGNGDWSEVKELEIMYWALSMLSSCFAYGGVKGFFNKHGIGYEETYYQHYLNDYLENGGTKEDYDKMLDIQCEHYQRFVGSEIMPKKRNVKNLVSITRRFGVAIKVMELKAQTLLSAM